METKPCVKCGSTERYKPSPGKKIGACKACKKTRDKIWNKANPKKCQSYVKAWKKTHPEKNRAYAKIHRTTNPEKVAARLAVRKAIRCTDLPRVSTCDCVDCGIQAAEYHHEDYSKPLEVEPLCKLCHVKRHNPDN